jgi:predicted oxidoreductase
VARGIRLTSYPEFLTPADRPPTLAGRVARRLWLLKAGLDRPEYWRHAWHERRVGCAFPGRTYVVRPNGAVFPCLYWDREPLGVYPADGLGRFQASATLGHIREGLGSGCPVGTCATCSQRRDALYRPFRVVPGVS